MSNEDEENKSIDFKKSVEKATEFQQNLLREFSTIQYNAFQNMFSSLQGFTNYNAMFKTNVQTGGRISIPEAERQALGIEEGDLVQVISIPLTRKKKNAGTA
jgi:anaerobic selenocysteine-containing dehydrogenase